MRILFVAPSCYPVYGPEANVNAKVVKVLSEAGHTIDLVTGKTSAIHYLIEDDNVFFRNVNSVNVVPRNNKLNFKAIWEYIRTFLKTNHVYKSIAGALPMINKCEELIETNKYDVILTKDYPSEVVGLHLTKKYNIPWLPTWNDPYMMVKFPPPYGKGYDHYAGYFRERLIKDIAKNAAINIFPSMRLRDYMLKYMHGMALENCAVIPHILTEEFVVEKERNNTDFLSLIYAGSLSKERDPQPLYDGFKLFIASNPDAKIHVDIMGVYEGMPHDFISQLINNNGLAEYFSQLPRATYSESNEITAKYDVNIILEAACSEGIFLPSKVPNCLQNKGAIMAISPAEGTLNDLYRTGIVDYFADITSTQSIADELGRIYTDYKNGKISNTKKDVTQFLDKTVLQLHEEVFNIIHANRNNN